MSEKAQFSIDETTGEVLQHDGFLRYVIAESLYKLVERLANEETKNKTLHATIEAQAQELARLKFLFATIRNRCQNEAKGNPAQDILATLASELPELMQDTPAPQAEGEAVADAPVTPAPETISFVGMVASTKKYTTKHGETMAVLEIGGYECVAFPRTWQEYKDVLGSGKMLTITGVTDYSKGKLQVIIQDASIVWKVGDKVVSSSGGIGIIQAFLPDGYVQTSSFMALAIDLHPDTEESAHDA